MRVHGERLVILRKERGQPQPTLDAIRKLSRALSMSADILLSAHNKRGSDDDPRLQLEAASRLDPEKKNAIRLVIESIVLRNTFETAGCRFTEGGSTR